MPSTIPTSEEFESLVRVVDIMERRLTTAENTLRAFEWVSLKQASKILHIKTTNIVSLKCRSGELEGKYEGKTLLVSMASINSYNERKSLRKTG